MVIDKIQCCDCLDGLKSLPDECIDLTVTSPPYDNLRTYNGYSWNFDGMADELLRITKSGGVIVWIVADATVDGSETGSSFRQALHFKEIGFNLHDTMIWQKPTFTATGSLAVRYASVFEYMFILSKGKPKTFNPIKDRANKSAGIKKHGTIRQKNGQTKKASSIGKQIQHYGQRFNVWEISGVQSSLERCHPAQFPVKLAKDHIISWSNKGDIVLDPFMGSGSTAIACIETKRHFVGFEISDEYCRLAEERIEKHKRSILQGQMSIDDLLSGGENGKA